MANTYKNIVITPNIDSATDDPKIQFSGANSSVNTDITLRVYPTANGTLSFEGSAGQLFSITNDLSGTIFSVNDVSGIPSIDVNANGLVQLAPYGGNVSIEGSTFFVDTSSGKVGIGTLSPAANLHVIGTANITTSLTLGTLDVASAIGSAYNKANDANVLAFNSAAGANAWTNTVYGFTNTYTRTVGASSNAWTNTVYGFTNSYTQTVGTAGNNYSITIGASSNAWTNTVYGFTNSYTQTVGTASNNYSITIGASSNAWVNTVYGFTNTFTHTIGGAAFFQANQAFAKANAANVLAFTSGDEAEGAFLRGNITFTHANAAFFQANQAFLKANNALANTAGITTAGTLFVPSALYVRGPNTIHALIEFANTLIITPNSGNWNTSIRLQSMITTGDPDSIRFLANGKQLLFLNDDGYVGVGGSFNPTANLHVLGNAIVSTTLTVGATDVTNAIGASFEQANQAFARANTANANFTAANILSRLITVDGTGSLLDADTIDGWHQSELGSKQLTSGSVGTGTTADFSWVSAGTISWSGPAPNYLSIVLRGLSHGAATSQPLRVEFSDDKGVTFTAVANITSPIAAASAINGHILLYRPSAASATKVIVWNTGTQDRATSNVGTWELPSVGGTAAISNVRFGFASGNFDAGTVYVLAFA